MTIKARLARLEAQAPERNNVYIFADDDETAEAAIKRHYPDGAPEGGNVTVFRWAGGKGHKQL